MHSTFLNVFYFVHVFNAFYFFLERFYIYALIHILHVGSFK